MSNYVPPYLNSMGSYSLTPTYGLGSGSRTSASMLLGSPRSKYASLNRLYKFAKYGDTRIKRCHPEYTAPNYGPQFIAFVMNTIGTRPQSSSAIMASVTR